MNTQKNIKNCTFSQRFLNITKSEWERVVPAFLVKLLFQIVLIMGGTILVALFIEQFTIESLPILFIIQALCVMLGTVLVSAFLKKNTPSSLISIFSAIAALSIFLSSVFFPYDKVILFPALIFSLSLLMSQVYIWLSLFIENLFSPLESERVFPVIESSEPIGGILSGLLIITLVEKVSVLNMLTISGAILLAIPILMYFAVQKLESISVLRTLREERNTKNSQKKSVCKWAPFFSQSSFCGRTFCGRFF
jgi:hypothetical protein